MVAKGAKGYNVLSMPLIFMRRVGFRVIDALVLAPERLSLELAVAEARDFDWNTGVESNEP